MRDLDADALEAAARAIWSVSFENARDDNAWEAIAEDTRAGVREEARRAIAAYLSHLWKPIETLPKSGLYLLASPAVEEEIPDLDEWRYDIWAARAYHCALSPDATRAQAILADEARKKRWWMELPKPPARAAAGGGDG